jgi:putative transposase
MLPFSKEMRLMRKATTTRKVDYFRLPRPLRRKVKKCLPKKRNKARRGGRPRASDRAEFINGIWCFGVAASGRRFIGIGSGSPQSVIHERFQRWTKRGIFEKLMKRMVEYYARERGGVGWRWQAMDSKNSPAPLGGEKMGKNPTDRGKLGAKIKPPGGRARRSHLGGAHRSQSLRHKVSAVDLIVSVATKRPAHKEQHLCADKAYDATGVKGVRRLGGLHSPHQSRSQKEERRRTTG